VTALWQKISSNFVPLHCGEIGRFSPFFDAMEIKKREGDARKQRF
jgi:hypothetical protein